MKYNFIFWISKYLDIVFLFETKDWRSTISDLNWLFRFYTEQALNKNLSYCLFSSAYLCIRNFQLFSDTEAWIAELSNFLEENRICQYFRYFSLNKAWYTRDALFMFISIIKKIKRQYCVNFVWSLYTLFASLILFIKDPPYSVNYIKMR